MRGQHTAVCINHFIGDNAAPEPTVGSAQESQSNAQMCA